jgi:Mg2+ and Co2+ transporter CorA
MTHLQKYERIKEATGVDEAMYDVAQREIFATRIVEFLTFAKRVQPLFANVKNGLARQLTTK